MSVPDECQSLQTVIMKLQHEMQDRDFMEAWINKLEGLKTEEDHMDVV